MEMVEFYIESNSDSNAVASDVVAILEEVSGAYKPEIQGKDDGHTVVLCGFESADSKRNAIESVFQEVKGVTAR